MHDYVVSLKESDGSKLKQQILPDNNYLWSQYLREQYILEQQEAEDMYYHGGGDSGDSTSPAPSLAEFPSIANLPVDAYSGVYADQNKIIVIGLTENGNIYTTLDNGNTWSTKTGPGGSMGVLRVTSDGALWLASRGDGGGTYKSMDGGTTWSIKSDLKFPNNLYVSTDGIKIFVSAEARASIYSTDGGDTFTESSQGSFYTVVNGTPDGSKIVLCKYPTNTTGPGYSLDYGATVDYWNVTSNTLWNSVSISDDGNTIVAIAASGGVWFSINGGTDWVQSLAEFVFATTVIDPSGLSMAVATSAGVIYVSKDYGSTWNQLTAIMSGGPGQLSTIVNNTTLYINTLNNCYQIPLL